MKNNNSLRAFSLVELSIVILIIGIMIAGVTEGTRLLFVTKLNTARTTTDSSPAPSVKNLSLWIDSTSEKSFDDIEAEDNAKITNWYDINPQTSVKNNFTQSIIIRKPTYTFGAINGLPALRFNKESVGSEDFMSSVGFGGISSSSTIFLVIKTPSILSSAQTIISKVISDNSGTNLQADINSTELLYCDGTDAQNCYTGTTEISTNQVYVISIVYSFNTIDTGIKFYKNGGIAISATTSNSPETSGTGDLFIGKSGLSGVEQYFNGHIGEVIIFDRALKDEERISIQNYLGKKWGVKIF